MNKLISIILFMSVFSGIKAQTFSDDPEDFLDDVEDYFSRYDKRKTRDFIKKIEDYWLEQYPGEKQKTVIKTLNLLDEKNLRAMPTQFNYFKGALSIVREEYPGQLFAKWHKKISVLSKERNTRNLKNFVKLTSLIFGDKSIYQSRSVNWNIRGKKFDFKSDRRTYITFKNADLIGLNKEDSVVIHETSGAIEINTKTLEGEGGVINWEKVGLDPKNTYAELTDYKFNVRSTSIRSDSVVMHNNYFEKPLMGELLDNTFNHEASVAYPYPQFNSYSGELSIKDIIPGINYIGGFTLKGASFIGAGASNKNATLTFERKNLPFVKVSAKRFTISEEKILGENANVNMKIGEVDSITHPGINVSYLIQDEQLDLYRGKSGASQAPFRNSYHKVDMYCDRIVWERKSPQLRLTYSKNSSQRIAVFESVDYYSERLYQKLQGFEDTHPLVAINNYAYKYDKYTLKEGEVATVLGRTTQQAKPQMLKLASYGFISYDTKNGQVKVLPKLENYIKNRAGKKDYDNIVFRSDLNEKRMKKQGKNGQRIKRDSAYYAERRELKRENLEKANTDNATLDLQNLDLLIRGTKRVSISENQNVAVYPSDDQVLVKKDRDFLFQGYLNAGKAEILLNEGSFDYSEFKVNLMDVEFMRFRVRPIFNKDENKPKRMASKIENMNGFVLIDDTSNRAGINPKFHDYPKINSFKESYVFYEYEPIFNNAYDTTDFYFELEPFKMDSLDNFDEKNLAFNGELHSAGIFPTFSEKIKIQPDYSFGFQRHAPAGGFDFYGTGAKYENEIRLSNRGLRGSGTINFITSTAVSDDYAFLPDSTVGLAQTYTNDPQGDPTEYPKAEGKNIYITYVPDNKVMKAKSTRSQIKMFDDQARIQGKLNVQPKGMTGRGFMTIENATLDSKIFEFGEQTIDADTSDFDLKSLSSDNIAFKTYNVNAHISFAERKGEFTTNGENSYVEFPDNQYICYMDRFNWYMDSEDIELEKDDQDVAIETDMKLKGSNFYSIHPDQDSLNFMAPKARFNIENRTIKCSEVEFIDIADARIFPDSNKVTIRKKAQMDPLKNSEIVANTITEYHKIINATTQIKAKNVYTSKGDYSYVDAEENKFVIQMEEIYVDTTLQTRAKGSVKKDEEFRLSPHFDFYGDVKMQAGNEFLNFDGATRIIHECSEFNRNWMSFDTEINPNEIYIPVNKDIKDLEGNAIAAGIALSKVRDSIGFYPTFLSKKKKEENPMVITSEGFLHYDKGSNEFQISNKKKLVERGRPGNFIALHTESCSMNGEGDISFGVDLGMLKIDPFGFVDYNMNKKSTSVRWAGAADFYIDDDIIEYIAEKINKVVDLEPLNTNLAPFYKSIQAKYSEKLKDKVKSDITLGKFTKMPKDLRAPFYFGDIDFEAKDDGSRIYYISQDELGIAGMLDIPVVKNVPGNVVLEVAPGNYHVFHIYIQPPGGKYYYFRIEYDTEKNTEMMITTNDKDLREIIEGLDKDDKKDKNFEYYLSTSTSRLTQFKRIIQE